MRLTQGINASIASGEISIYRRKNGVSEKILTSNNAVLPNAKYLMTRWAMWDATAQLTNIRVFDNLDFKSPGIITTRTYVNPNEVQFETVLTEDSFAGDFNKVLLGPSDNVGMGDFSKVEGFTVVKAADEEILITWNIKFN